jgi:hypothetical protein
MSKQFLVNTYSGQWQESPDIARLKNGDFIVVWQSFFFEDDLSLYYVAGQRFSASGEKLGGELILDSDLVRDGGASTSPTVTALKDGGYAVAWENSPDGILGSTDVYTRAFNANGKERGDSVRIHQKSGDDQIVPEVSARGDGYFVSYTDYDGPDPWKANNVYLQRFDGDGHKVGDGSRINQVTDFDQQSAQSAELSNGDTIVIWDSEYAGRDFPGAAGQHAVRGRIYDSDGRAVTKEFMVSDDNGHISSAISPDTSIDVAALPRGRFVATWYETKLHDDRDTTFEIHARVFDSTGDAVGPEFKVGGDDSGVAKHSAVIGLEGGGFVVAWDAPGEGFRFQEAYARVYEADGDAVGAKFRLHPPSGRSDQEFPELAPLKNGGFFAVYESEFLDGDDDAIAGRIFNLGSAKADSAELAEAGTFAGFGGHDRAVGGSGADALLGGRGADTLSGGAGADTVAGGRGRDVLEGGDGADVFVFAQSSLGRIDVVRDFEAADMIDLSGVDADAGQNGDQAFRFVGADAFSGAAGELRYHGGRLSGDVDGDGHADLRIDVDGLGKDALVL